MKKFLKGLLTLVLLLGCVFTIVGCGKTELYEKILNSYLLEQDGQTVSSDFVLPAVIDYENESYEITWKSSDSCIAIEKREKELENADGTKTKVVDYLAKVSFPSETKDVTLTLTLGKVEKVFTVRVMPIDVYTFYDKYVFPKDKATIFESFDLDKEFAIGSEKATITWSVEDKYTDYIEVKDGKCMVYPSSLNPEVRIKATFSYKGEETVDTFRMVVSMEKSHFEDVDYWYTNTGVSLEMKGYIVAIGTKYAESYKNVTFYMVDEDFQSGYYIYRGECSVEDAKNLVPGAYVVITNTTNTNYNGLIETNAKGQIAFDAKKNITVEELNSHIYAADNDLIGAVPSAIHHESQLVSLTDWEVKSVEKAPEAGKTATLFTITKGGVDVPVIVSKYLEGAYMPNANDTVYSDLVKLVDTVKVGDIVSVTGILGNYKGFQVMPLTAADVKKGTKDTATEFAGKKVAALIAENAKIIPSTIIVTNKEFTLLTKNEANDVTVKYELCSNSNAVALDGAKFTITPSKQEKINVLCTYTCGDYSTKVVFSIWSKLMSPEQIAETEAKDYVFDAEYKAGVTEVTTDPKTFEGTTFVFTVTDPNSMKLVSFEGNKMILTAVDEDTTVKVNVTAKYDGKLSTVEKQFKILVSEFNTYVAADTPVADKEYYLGASDGILYYFVLGVMDGNYGKTDFAYANAPKAFAEASGEGYKIYLLSGTTKTYVSYVISGDYVNCSFGTNADEATVWTWDAEKKTITAMVSGKLHWMGTRLGSSGSVYSTIGVYADEKYALAANTSYPLHLYEVTADTTDTTGRAQKEADAYKAPGVMAKGDEVTLASAGTIYSDVVITYALKEASDFFEIADGKLKAISATEEKNSAVVVVTFSCGLAKIEKEITVEVEPLTITNKSCDELYDMAYAAQTTTNPATVNFDGTYIVYGIVASLDSYKNIYISTDGTTTKQIECYYLVNDAVKVGDVVCVKGKLVNYYNANKATWTIEFAKGCTLEEHYPLTTLEVCPTLEDGKLVYVTGTVAKIDTAYSSQYNNITITLSDETGTFYLYRVKGGESIIVGSKLGVYGKIGSYSGAKQLAAGGVIAFQNNEVALTDAEALDLAKVMVADLGVSLNADYTLPTTLTIPGYEGTVSISWKQGETDVTTITYDSPAESKEVKLVATVKCGEAQEDVEVTFTIAAKVNMPEVGKAYKFAIEQKNLSKTLYINGNMNGYYFETTEDPAEGIDIYIEVVTGGYRIYHLVGDAKKYIEIVKSGTHFNVQYNDTASVVWTWDASLDTFVTEIEGKNYYIGTYNTYNTGSASSTDKAPTSFVGHYVTVE